MGINVIIVPSHLGDIYIVWLMKSFTNHLDHKEDRWGWFDYYLRICKMTVQCLFHLKIRK